MELLFSEVWPMSRQATKIITGCVTFVVTSKGWSWFVFLLSGSWANQRFLGLLSHTKVESELTILRCDTLITVLLQDWLRPEHNVLLTHVMTHMCSPNDTFTEEVVSSSDPCLWVWALLVDELPGTQSFLACSYDDAFCKVSVAACWSWWNRRWIDITRYTILFQRQNISFLSLLALSMNCKLLWVSLQTSSSLNRYGWQGNVTVFNYLNPICFVYRV